MEFYTNPVNTHLTFDDLRGPVFRCPLNILQKQLYSPQNVQYLKKRAIMYADKINMEDPYITDAEVLKHIHDALVLEGGKIAARQEAAQSTVLYNDMPVNTILGGGTLRTSKIPSFKQVNRDAEHRVKHYMHEKHNAQKYGNLIWLSKNQETHLVSRPYRITSERIRRGIGVHAATARFQGC